jgi:glutaredoxin
MGTRRHVRAPKITLVTSSIAVTRAKRVSFARLHALLEAKRVKFEHVDLALQDRAEEVQGISGSRELPQVFLMLTPGVTCLVRARSHAVSHASRCAGSHQRQVCRGCRGDPGA